MNRINKKANKHDIWIFPIPERLSIKDKFYQQRSVIVFGIFLLNTDIENPEEIKQAETYVSASYESSTKLSFNSKELCYNNSNPGTMHFSDRDRVPNSADIKKWINRLIQLFKNDLNWISESEFAKLYPSKVNYRLKVIDQKEYYHIVNIHKRQNGIKFDSHNMYNHQNRPKKSKTRGWDHTDSFQRSKRPKYQ